MRAMPHADSHLPDRDTIRGWTTAQRLAVARELDGMVPRPTMNRPLHRRRTLVLAITGGGAVLLAPWVVYLSNALPPTEHGGAWRIAWVGFDGMLAATLAITAWLVWRRRFLALLGLAASTALLVVDAWFDITLSWGTSEQWGAIATTCIVNVPVTVLLASSVITMLRRTFEVIGQLRGVPEHDVSIWRQPVVMAPPGDG
jgi:hypothetical protein